MPNTTRPATRRKALGQAVALTLLGVGVALPPRAMAQSRTDTIALTGQAAPGVGGGTFNTLVQTPVLNDSGQAAFYAGIASATGTQGIFRSDSTGVITALARQAQGAPGVGAGVFSAFGTPVLNASGQTGFYATIVGGTSTQGIFRSDSASALTPIALLAQSAPGTGAGTLSNLGLNPGLNASGQTAFYSSIGGSTSSSGIFRSDSASGLTAIARTTQAVPGAGAGTLSSFSASSLSANVPINASGQTAFYAGITGGTSNQGIFRSDSAGTLTAIALQGQNAPGTGAGTFSSLSATPVLNGSGQTAFTAGITGGTSTLGIFRSDSASGLTAIALLGQSAPGTGAGTFSSLSNPVLNVSGQTAFTASITGSTSGSGIFRSDSAGALTAIVLQGQNAPGTGAGTFSSFSGNQVLNAGGQTAFYANITGGTSNQGLFIADGRDTVAIQVQGASLAGKTVSVLSIGGVGPGGLNNSGQVAYETFFSDASNGIFLFTPALRWRESFSASWDTASSWTLGIAPGSVHDVTIDPSATLSVTGPAGAVNVRSLTVGSGTGFATLALNGGSIGSGNAVQVASRGILAGNGTISAQVVNAGEVRADNLILSGGLVNNGTVLGAATGNQRIDTNLTNNASGLVRVGGGEMLKLVGSAHGNSGSAEVRDGGEWQVTGAFTNAAAGRIVLNGGIARFNSGLTNNGQMQVSFGGGEIFGAVTTNAGGKVIISGNSNATFYDSIDVKSGGELRVSTGANAVFFGQVFQRTGAIFGGGGTKFYEGVFTFGGSPGFAVDGGDVNLGSGSVFMVDIGGITPCTADCETDAALKNGSYDKYVVEGHLSLGGTLKLGSWDGFVAQPGQSFDLLDWGSVDGHFDRIDASGLALGDGLRLDTSQLAIDGSFSVVAVPEPAGWALMLTGLTGLTGLAGLTRRGFLSQRKCPA